MTSLDWFLLTWWMPWVALCWAMDHYGWGAEHNDGKVSD